MPWPNHLTEQFMFECYKHQQAGNFWTFVDSVIEFAITHKHYPGKIDRMSLGGDNLRYLTREDKESVPEIIRQLMWRHLTKGLIVFGTNPTNGDWPNYRLTGLGENVINGQRPQPYDQANFLAEFRNINPTVDSVIYDYFEEAVKAFNSDCMKSSAVMLGAASEKAILLLLDIFTIKITDPIKRRDFDTEIARSWMISTRFRSLYDRLILMANANRFPRNSDLKDIVIRDMPGFFDLVRRLRNIIGHPETVPNFQPETIFLNLRVFTEYIKSIYKLIDYFNANNADW